MSKQCAGQQNGAQARRRRATQLAPTGCVRGDPRPLPTGPLTTSWSSGRQWSPTTPSPSTPTRRRPGRCLPVA